MPIVCGTDLSEGGAEAVAAAVALASLRGDNELILVHAIEDAGDDQAAFDKLAAEARTKVAAVAAAAKGGFAIEVTVTPLPGSAVDGIIGVADTEGADLIVLGAQ